MEVDKRSVLPRALKIDHARNPAVFRQGCTRCFVEQNRFVARFRLEFAIEVALLPRQQQYAVGLEGLVVVRVDFDGVGPRPQERRVVVAAPPGGDLAYAQFLAGLEQHQLDAGHRLPRGIRDGPAQRSRLGLREQQSRRYGKEQKSIEPANHACLTVASLADPRASHVVDSLSGDTEAATEEETHQEMETLFFGTARVTTGALQFMRPGPNQGGDARGGLIFNRSE